MNYSKQQIWFGLDDIEEISSLGNTDPKPLYNEKSQREQDKALQNPEQSIDKDPEKPWVQGNKDQPGVKREESAEKIQDEYDDNPARGTSMREDLTRNGNED